MITQQHTSTTDYPAHRSGLHTQLLHNQSQPKASCGFGLTVHKHNKASHKLLENALCALVRMEHRGTMSHDKKTGDGCGILLQKPDAFLRAECAAANVTLPKTYAVGVFFMPHDDTQRVTITTLVATHAKRHGIELLHVRDVPINPDVLGEEGRTGMPHIEQHFFVTDNASINWQLVLFNLERELRQAVDNQHYYAASLSLDMVSYKGMMIPDLLPEFYPDLANPALETAICVFHQRFATNTLPSWRLAQPFSMLAHNGEINSIAGNRNWAQARVAQLVADSHLNADLLQPAVTNVLSDSASLNDMLQLLIAGGMDILSAIRILVPPAFRSGYAISNQEAAFFTYHGLHMEPWDGPAGIVLTDGRYAICTLDRHGLRPARWVVTDDDVVMLASEVGLHAPDTTVVQKGRVAPGGIIAIDTHAGEILERGAIDVQLASKQPYTDWLETHSFELDHHCATPLAADWLVGTDMLLEQQLRFQLDREEIDLVLKPFITTGMEATSSMGDDTPIAVLSRKTRMLSDYFRQMFAQVTNPPIDPIRESRGMSLRTELFVQSHFFSPPDNDEFVFVAHSPVLSSQQFAHLLSLNTHQNTALSARFAHQCLSLGFDANTDLRSALVALQKQAVALVQSGCGVLVLSDKHYGEDELILNALLAVGAVHHALIDAGCRLNTNIIIATGTVRDSHQLATLLGFGADIVYPYLAYATAETLAISMHIDKEEALASYRKGLDKALLKVMSKMGISCVASYRGAKLFEALGLHPEVVDMCFTGCKTPIGGATFADLQKDEISVAQRTKQARMLPNNGLVKYNHYGEFHCYNPDVVTALIESVKIGSFANYQHTYADPINNRTPVAVRDLFWLNKKQSIVIDEVESVESIMRRFDSAGMSIGALAPEAHEVLAMAMNQIGGRSNSGEGGEDASRFATSRNSKIKQVASGRFGVTPSYLASAEVLQIKIAQGAKPGEGGQLPGEKVNAMIARLRHSTEGVTLISPPPHHDIYSIEDIAQLIFDLKQVNPEALVSVKLVSEPGIGTIAAGLTKAYVDLITVSGHDGGTGASPLSSIRYAGSVWELGLVEVQQALRINNLRHRVLLQADGGFKTGLDVIKAAALGAESFGFGTTALVALGCKFIRVCHLNNCPTGVNTQNETLRQKHFQGEVERVVRFFSFVAQETRQWLAYLGVRSIDEVIGRPEYLQVREHDLPDKQQHLSLQKLLVNDYVAPTTPRTCQLKRNEPHDQQLLAKKIDQALTDAIVHNANARFPASGVQAITNSDRAIGARVSGAIAKRYGATGYTGQLTLHFSGSAGQSFAAFNAHGVHMHLHGDANDYVGKSMAGGTVVITPPTDAAFASNSASIAGNTCLYGATAGLAYISGRVGERFAVRNSGAVAVIEGAGDHLCEYMTGGAVLALGKIGINAGAGMTGGVAFAYYKDIERIVKTASSDVVFEPVVAQTAAHAFVIALLKDYIVYTNSKHGELVLADVQLNPQHLCQVRPVARQTEELLQTVHFQPLASVLALSSF